MFWQVSSLDRTGVAVLGSLPSAPGPSWHPVRSPGPLLKFGLCGGQLIPGDGPIFIVDLHLKPIHQQRLEHQPKGIDVDLLGARRSAGDTRCLGDDIEFRGIQELRRPTSISSGLLTFQAIWIRSFIGAPDSSIRPPASGPGLPYSRLADSA